MKTGIDTIGIFTPIEIKELDSDKFKVISKDFRQVSVFDSDRMETVRLRDEKVDGELGVKLLWVDTVQKGDDGLCFSVKIPSLPRLLDKGFIGDVGYEGVREAISEIESEYFVNSKGRNWYVDRLDIKADIEIDKDNFFTDYFIELWNWYDMRGQWRKERFFDGERGETVLYRVKRGKEFQVYNKGEQVKRIYNREIGDFLRLETRFSGQRYVKSIGIQAVEDITSLNAIKVIFDRYSKLRLVSEGGYRGGEILEVLASEYHRQKQEGRKQIRVDIRDVILDIADGYNEILKIDTKWFIKDLVSRGVDYLWAYRQCRKLENIQLRRLANKTRIKRKGYVEQVGKLLESAV